LLVAGSEVPTGSQLMVPPVSKVLMSAAVEEKGANKGLQTPCIAPADKSNHVIQRLLMDEIVSTGDDSVNIDTDTTVVVNRRQQIELIEEGEHTGERQKPSAETGHTDVIVEDSPLPERTVETATVTIDTEFGYNKSSCAPQGDVMCKETPAQPTETTASTCNEDVASSQAVDVYPMTADSDQDRAMDCSFDGILNSFNNDGGTMITPLPTALTPLQTPVHDTHYGEETILLLHPSPNPALEESAASSAVGKVRSPVRAPEQSSSKVRRDSPQKKKLSSSISRTESRKENVKRSSDEEDLGSKKWSKGSSSASNDRSRDEIQPRFKIPLKPAQDRSVKQTKLDVSLRLLLSKTDQRTRARTGTVVTIVIVLPLRVVSTLVGAAPLDLRTDSLRQLLVSTNCLRNSDSG